MQTIENTTKILDFNAFRDQRNVPAETANTQYTPTLVWYPVWVLVPNQPTNNS